MLVRQGTSTRFGMLSAWSSGAFGRNESHDSQQFSSEEVSLSALWIAAAALAGFVLPFQAAANAELGRQTPTLFHAALINFVVGAVLLGILAVATPGRSMAGASLSHTPWWSWIGGVIGAGYVAMTVRAAPALGTVVMLAVEIAGQMAGSLAADHVGMMGLAKRPISWEKICGLVLVGAGVLLILRKR